MSSIESYTRGKQQPAYRIYWNDHNYKRKTKVLYLTKAQARNAADRLEREAEEIRQGIRPNPDLEKTLGEAFEMFKKSLKGEGRSQLTIDRYDVAYQTFKRLTGEDTQLSAILPTDIEEYKLERLSEVQPVTVNTDLRHLKAFFTWAVKLDLLQKTPLRNIKRIRESHREVRFLSSDELKALHKAIVEWDNAAASDLVTFYLQTGVRAREILPETGFTWDSVKKDHIVIIGKGDKQRSIPLNETLNAILDRNRDKDVPFPYTYHMVYTMIVKNLYSKAKIKGANLHTLRKTAGALLIQNGIDIYRVSKFLGHSAVSVTEKHYVDLIQSDYTSMSETLEECMLALKDSEDDSKPS